MGIDFSSLLKYFSVVENYSKKVGTDTKKIISADCNMTLFAGKPCLVNPFNYFQVLTESKDGYGYKKD